jgi:hypothetical protein
MGLDNPKSPTHMDFEDPMEDTLGAAVSEAAALVWGGKRVFLPPPYVLDDCASAAVPAVPAEMEQDNVACFEALVKRGRVSAACLAHPQVFVRETLLGTHSSFEHGNVLGYHPATTMWFLAMDTQVVACRSLANIVAHVQAQQVCEDNHSSTVA